jgi:hypothetical protein
MPGLQGNTFYSFLEALNGQMFNEKNREKSLIRQGISGHKTGPWHIYGSLRKLKPSILINFAAKIRIYSLLFRIKMVVRIVNTSDNPSLL